MAETRTHGRHGKGRNLRGVRGRQVGSAEASCSHSLTFTSSRSTRNSGHEQFGVFPMRSRRHSRNWIPSHNSRRLPSWANSLKLSSQVRSRLRAVSASRPQPTLPVLSKRSESVEFTRDSLKEGRSHRHVCIAPWAKWPRLGTAPRRAKQPGKVSEKYVCNISST